MACRWLSPIEINAQWPNNQLVKAMLMALILLKAGNPSDALPVVFNSP